MSEGGEGAVDGGGSVAARDAAFEAEFDAAFDAARNANSDVKFAADFAANSDAEFVADPDAAFGTISAARLSRKGDRLGIAGDKRRR